jgi:hypothetical protein
MSDPTSFGVCQSAATSLVWPFPKKKPHQDMEATLAQIVANLVIVAIPPAALRLRNPYLLRRISSAVRDSHHGS